MLNPKEICIEDKPLFLKLLPKSESSIYNFTTLYMWSGGGKIKYDVIDGCLVLVFYTSKSGIGCTYPIGSGDREKAAHACFRFMKDAGNKPRFMLMEQQTAKECYEVFPGQFQIYSDRDNADYVYLTESLITLRGKKFHTKKNHLNAFLNAYDFRYARLGPQNRDECVNLFLNWQKTQTNHSAGFSEDATMRLLNHAEELDVKMGGIYVDERLVAFSAGEPITDDMALIHLEYADASVRGAFNIMNQQFLENEWKDYTFVNREEDMGLEGLRKAKLAYRPVRLVEKYFTK